MLESARLTLEADVDGDGAVETGVFSFDGPVEISPGIRTGNLIGPTGSNVGALVDVVTGNDAGRAGFRLDAGGGAFVITVNFRGWEGSTNRWGDGSGEAKADAEGEGVFRQLSVLMRYLNRGEYDSRGGATFEYGEYSSSGVYAPINVAPEEPQVSFSAEEQISTFDGSITLVATRSIEQAAVSQQQDQR
jgi:hypothetical protein